MDKEKLCIIMGSYMMDNGLIINKMEKESRSYNKPHFKDNFLMGKEMVKAKWFGILVRFMKDHG